MIPLCRHFDLGRDQSRIKDPADGYRQKATVEALLKRFFASSGKDRLELQVLADEVGMGKTFVSLGVAYSVLQHLKNGRPAADLDGCYQRVLVLTPTNDALFQKWIREVSEFRRRCIGEDEADPQFAAARAERFDDLAAELRKPGPQPQVIVARMSIAATKFQDYALKRRVLLGTLFRYWGARFRVDQRKRLLLGAPAEWGLAPGRLTALSAAEEDRLALSEADLLVLLNGLDAEGQERIHSLLVRCRAVAMKGFRNRAGAFEEIERELNTIYRACVARSIRRDFPLIIVDEAHHWKNGPRSGSNGYREFQRHLAPHARRLLLLTATPFQLRPSEMLDMLEAGDALQTSCAGERLRKFRLEKLQPALTAAEERSRAFSHAWSRLPAQSTPEELERIWEAAPVVAVRTALAAAGSPDAHASVEAALAFVDPDLRHFMREALLLFAANARLSRTLGQITIRHRRGTGHRLFRVGGEFEHEAAQLQARSDRHLLHAAPGMEVHGEGELPQYLLMRCVSEMKGGRGRSSLGSDLTGCYSTLMHSAEGQAAQRLLRQSPEGSRYLSLLLNMVREKDDPRHPKLSRVVARVEELWEKGEKVLIFCFRVNTAHRLREIISRRLELRLARRRERCLGGEAQLKALRSRLTGRDRDLVGIGLDRVLWSALIAGGEPCPFGPTALELEDAELSGLAELALGFGVAMAEERIDRVFLFRATEHLVARRLLPQLSRVSTWRRLFTAMADRGWVSHPYGLEAAGDPETDASEIATFERGCHTIYKWRGNPLAAQVASLADELRKRRAAARLRHQVSIFDAYYRGASLWFGDNPPMRWKDFREHPIGRTLAAIQCLLWRLTCGSEPPDWRARALLLQAMRRIVLRESVLVRLLPSERQRDSAGWGDLLARAFVTHLPGQRESMADRIAALLEDIEAASGDLHEPTSARHTWYAATRLRDQQFAALVGGGSAKETRERLLAGFNTPLLPEVLICTAVGQEGIDLHRHCRHVIHYDLAWNPAVLEQRTGRADRIGSKTFRERAASAPADEVFLDVAVPFLAATYDERMFEELRLRAQTFEVLTGGDFASDHLADDGSDAEPGAERQLRLVPLPSAMIEALRVNLHVWSAGQ